MAVLRNSAASWHLESIATWSVWKSLRFRPVAV